MAVHDENPPSQWEDPLPTITGRAWTFGMRLAATDILPARFVGARMAPRHLFADIDAGLAVALGSGDVVVAEEQVGTAAAAAPATAALQAAGVSAMVARRFDAAVEDAALAAGIVTVTLDVPTFLHTGDRVRIDLDSAKIVNLSSGDRAPIRNLTEAHRATIRAMLRRLGADA